MKGKDPILVTTSLASFSITSTFAIPLVTPVLTQQPYDLMYFLLAQIIL